MAVLSKLLRAMNKAKKPKSLKANPQFKASSSIQGLRIKAKLLLPMITLPDPQPAMALFRAGGHEKKKGKPVVTLTFSKDYVSVTMKNCDEPIKGCTTVTALAYKNIVSVDTSTRKNEVAITCKRPITAISYWCICLKLKAVIKGKDCIHGKSGKITGKEMKHFMQPLLRANAYIATPGSSGVGSNSDYVKPRVSEHGESSQETSSYCKEGDYDTDSKEQKFDKVVQLDQIEFELSSDEFTGTIDNTLEQETITETPDVAVEQSTTCNEIETPDVAVEQSSICNETETPDVAVEQSSTYDETETPDVAVEQSNTCDETETPDVAVEQSNTCNETETPDVAVEQSNTCNETVQETEKELCLEKDTLAQSQIQHNISCPILQTQYSADDECSNSWQQQLSSPTDSELEEPLLADYYAQNWDIGGGYFYFQQAQTIHQIAQCVSAVPLATTSYCGYNLPQEQLITRHTPALSHTASYNTHSSTPLSSYSNDYLSCMCRNCHASFISSNSEAGSSSEDFYPLPMINRQVESHLTTNKLSGDSYKSNTEQRFQPTVLYDKPELRSRAPAFVCIAGQYVASPLLSSKLTHHKASIDINSIEADAY